MKTADCSPRAYGETPPASVIDVAAEDFKQAGDEVDLSGLEHETNLSSIRTMRRFSPSPGPRRSRSLSLQGHFVVLRHRRNSIPPTNKPP
jgi:hypothetical protein